MASYQELGLTPIINAAGSVTRLGGAPMPREVIDAFCQAAAACVPLEDLQGVASKRIAAATGTEAGLVSAGAAAALTVGAAAILCGDDLGRMEQLPRCEGFPHEFLIAREQRSGYDHAVRASGAKLIEVGFNEIVAGAGVRRTEVWEYEAAITPNTAGILYVLAPDSQPALRDIVEMVHRHDLPVLVDAAGELPPRSNLRDIPGTGADLVAFSGGKAIRGPQSTGILCGRGELIRSAVLQMLDMDDHPQLWSPPAELIDATQLPGIPRHGIGRGYKVSKEEIVALLRALDLFAGGSYDEIVAGYVPRLERIARALDGLPLACHLIDKGDGESFPVLEITIDEPAVGSTAYAVCAALRQGDPPLYVGHGKLQAGTLVINPLHLSDEAGEIVARRIRAEIAAVG